MTVVQPLRPEAAATFDVEAVRRDFPILATEVYGKPLVYLDNAASAQKPRAVLERIQKAYTREYANVHRGLHYLSNAATEAYEDAREAVRAFLNAPSTDEIIFTRSSTEAINLVAQSFGGMRLGAGDEIVLSIMEHHSNIVPWHFHRERAGAVIKWAPIHEDGSFDLEAFEQLLTERTRMVSVVHMSNVTGTVVPVKEVCRIAHARGIPVLVDGSQSAVHLPIDVQDLGCDFFAFTGHKTYGPTGIGVLWGKREHLEAMPPYMGGGEMIENVTEDRVTYGTPPHKFEAGTPPIVQAIGLAAALRYMEGLGRDAIRAHEAELAKYAQEQLSALNYLKIFGSAPGKGAIVAFEMAGAHAHDVSTIIDREGVAVRAGTHCAQPLLSRYGVTSTCRASFGLYNTRAEVDALVKALAKAHSFFA
jgi:cysteine desulfurase/selenocysteine lyase